MKHFKGLVVAAFATGIAIGSYATSRYFSQGDSPVRLDDRTTTSAGMEPAKKNVDSLVYRPSFFFCECIQPSNKVFSFHSSNLRKFFEFF
ncbi:MAG TPA: hypothetical protein VJC07_02845 [Candidatus Nanoarchaeia archaeon]|nr:hypothetical protein [Candidatus Nanoarchaeia archaeon]